VSEGAVTQRQGSRNRNFAEREGLSLPPIPRQGQDPSQGAPEKAQSEGCRPISFVIRQTQGPGVSGEESLAVLPGASDEPPDWLENGEPPDIDSDKVTQWIEDSRSQQGFCTLVDAREFVEKMRILREQLKLPRAEEEPEGAP
jgi:hypothetical protein